jgi:hypothetical protein
MRLPVPYDTLNDAYGDLQCRTLSSMSCDLARLIYLAALRDYNSGTYHHDGLATRFGREQARDALETAHREVFYRLAGLSLADLVAELKTYIHVSREAPVGLIHAWQELEPYRVAVPMEVDTTVVRLFLSNIRIALEILRAGQQ